MKTNKIFCFLLSFLIICQCSVTALAAEMPENSSSPEAILYMQEKGVIKGYADGDLGLDKPLSYGELAVFLYRIRGLDLPAASKGKPWYSGAIAKLVSSGDLPNGLVIEDGGNIPVRNRAGIEILLPYFGIYPYPMSLYPDTELNFAGLESQKIAWNAALLIGLIHDDLDPNEIITRGQLMNWMYLLETGSHTPLECPNTHPIFTAIKSESDWKARNGFIKAMALIPEKYLQDFVDEGWSLYFDKDYDAFEESSMAIGITYYGDKAIAVRSADSSTDCHEFGHYVAHRTGISYMLHSFYDLESENLSGILREYAMTNAAEYFACFFAAWLVQPNLHEELEEKAPYTSALVRDALIGANGLVDKDLAFDLYSSAIDQLNAQGNSASSQ